MKLNRSKSMTRAYEFARVRECGISSAGRFLVVSILEDAELEDSKFGIICTRKVGKAHERNAIRRRMREILRDHGACYENGHYVVLVMRWRSAQAGYQELEQDFQRALRRLKRGEGRPAGQRAPGRKSTGK